MKKEFLDFMYDLRGSVQVEIDRLAELYKQPRDGNCEGCGDAIEAELRTRRSQLGSINKTIEQYLEIHR